MIERWEGQQSGWDSGGRATRGDWGVGGEGGGGGYDSCETGCDLVSRKLLVYPWCVYTVQVLLCLFVCVVAGGGGGGDLGGGNGMWAGM